MAQPATAYILIHTPEPVSLLRLAAECARPGGIVAFQEFDLRGLIPPHPAMPLFEQIRAWMLETLRRTLAHPDCGTRLYYGFEEAGLKAPTLQGDLFLDGGPDSRFYDWITESFRSILPQVVSSGVASAEVIDIDTFASRLRDEAVHHRGCTPGVIMIGAHAQA